MQTFNNSIKRTVQKILFTQMQLNADFTGLAGPSHEEYRKLAGKYFRQGMFLVDTEIDSPGVDKICITKTQPTRVMDCDFCKTYINAGESLKIVFKRMSELPAYHFKALMFTLSLRDVGLDNTLDWLNSNFFYNTLTYTKISQSLLVEDFGYLKIIPHNQYTFYKSFLIQYREKTHMLSGGLMWR